MEPLGLSDSARQCPHCGAIQNGNRGMVPLVFLLFFLLLAFSPVRGVSQRILTLRECYEKAEASDPLASENQAHTGIWQLRDANLSKGWLPSLGAGGQLVYNSSVVDLTEVMGALPVPGIGQLIKPLPHEQYKVTLEVSQMIYDGGAVKGSRAVERAGLQVQKKQTEADLYQLRSQVNGYYFNLLLLDRQKELLGNFLVLIEKRLASLESARENGMALLSDIDVLTSEKIRLQQQLTENRIRRASFLKLLSDITGTPVDDSAVLELPTVGESLPGELARPELDLFDLKREQLDASLLLLQSRLKPVAFGFATLGYGNPPGNNFFKDEFAPYYLIGAGLKWTLWDWARTRNEKQVVALQKTVLEGRRQELADHIRRALDAKKAEIASLGALLETDSSLIALRRRITATAESQYANGVVNATDYLQELHAEQQALINHEIHRISLLLARVEYLHITGGALP